MSDPTGLDDLMKIGTSVAGGGGAAGLFIKLIFGSAIADLKSQLSEARVGFKEQMSELKSDTREQLNGLKEMIERSDRRHDKTIEDFTTAKNSLMALHARQDSFEIELNAIKTDLLSKRRR